MGFEDEIITDIDKQHLAYGMCVLGVTATGATFGSLAGGQTLLGAAGGLVMGLFMCKSVQTPLKKALFSSNRMSERQFGALISQVRLANPTKSREQLLDMIAASRFASAREPWKYRI